MGLSRHSASLRLAGSAVLAAVLATGAGAVTLPHDPEALLLLPADRAAIGSLYARLAPSLPGLSGPVRTAPPGMTVRMTAPAVTVPRSALPGVRKVPLPATLPLYLSIWIVGTGLLGLAATRRRRPAGPAPRRCRPAEWLGLARCRRPGPGRMRRYRRSPARPGDPASRRSSASKL